ncbi:unnamed protein product [Lupinus luteus]|uniref:HMA domain-containing protein n=1 Tax=Lupinus luteus TaxID=3873 RepID=A0AAV1XKU5_LUPLU
MKMASTLLSSSSSSSLSLHSIPFSSSTTLSTSLLPFNLVPRTSFVKKARLSTVKAVEEQQATIAEQTPTVVVPVSPSDTLTMFFQAEGTLNETSIPSLTKALQETDGVANLNVRVDEGLAIVELKKQTTVQATGVASSLLETIQGSGFKLQTLHLSFDDEEDAAAAAVAAA